MYKLLDIVTNYEFEFDLDDVEALEVVGALEIGHWTDTFGPLGNQLYESFRPLVERALSTIDLQVVEEFADEWTTYRRKEVGICRRRSGRRVVSASYVCKRDRESSIKLANEHGYQLIDVSD